MGLHTGEPAVGSEGYLGIDVVRAARLCTVGRGGQVLLSETTRALVGSSLPDGVSVHTLGERHLKDIDEPERVFELDIEGAPTPAEAGGPAETAPEPPDIPAASPPPRRPSGPAPRSGAGADVRTARGRLRRAALGADPGARASEARRTAGAMFSEVDALADRATEHPETITEKLDTRRASDKKVTGWL